MHYDLAVLCFTGSVASLHFHLETRLCLDRLYPGNISSWDPASDVCLCCYSIRHINTSPRPPPPTMFSWSIRSGASIVSPTLPLPLPSPYQYNLSLISYLAISRSVLLWVSYFSLPLSNNERETQGRTKILLLLFHFCSCLVLFF